MNRVFSGLLALLQQAISFAGQRPGHVPSAIALEIDQFNAVALDECRQASVASINITDLTRAAAGSSSQFTSDGLHYAGPQMRLWAKCTLPVAQVLLK